MAHPHLLPPGDSAKNGIRGGQIQLRESVFALVAFLHGTAKKMRHELLPVANTQHRNPGIEEGGIDRGAARIVNARRTSRDDDPSASRQLRGWCFASRHFRVNAQLAHFAGDEMTVLSSG